MSLQKISNTQKKSISKYSRYLYELRKITTNLKDVLETDFTGVNISSVEKSLDILKEFYVKCSVMLDQFCILLKSIPEMTVEEAEFDSVLYDSPIVNCFKNSEEWTDLYKQVKCIMGTVNKQKTALLKLQLIPKQIGEQNNSLPVISQRHITALKDALFNLKTVGSHVGNLLNQYRGVLKHPDILGMKSALHPVLQSMHELYFCVLETQTMIKKLENSEDTVMDEDLSDVVVNQSEDLMATLLLIIQSVYKKHLPQGHGSAEILSAIDDIIEKDQVEKEIEESKELLEDKHFKEHLQDKLSADAKMLQLESVISKCQKLLRSYVQYVNTNNSTIMGTEAIMRMTLVLEQAILFVQYFVTQKVAVHRVTCKMLSVLLKIFSDLAAKG